MLKFISSLLFGKLISFPPPGREALLARIFTHDLIDGGPNEVQRVYFWRLSNSRGDSAFGRWDIALKWEREAEGEINYIWNVGGWHGVGMWEAVITKSQGGDLLVQNRSKKREMTEETRWIREYPSTKHVLRFSGISKFEDSTFLLQLRMSNIWSWQV